MKILHTADLHIGAELSYLDSAAEARKYEVLEVFKGITEICKKENVEICLIAGDLFDSNPAAKVFAEPVFRALSEAKGTRFFYVAGNHDPLDASSPFVGQKLPENLTIFGGDYETVELGDLGVRICGRSFTHSSMDFEYLSPMKEDDFVNILLMHSDFGAAGSIYNPIPHSFVEGCGADYIALGHIHKRTSVERVGKAYLSYPGCPEGQGFDETGEKGVYIGELSKGICDLKFLPCCTRMHIVKRVDASDFSSAVELADGIFTALHTEFGADFDKNLYKLILSGSCENPDAINLSELSAILKSRLYFVKLKNCMVERIDLELLSREISLKGIFVKKMLERIQSAENSEKKHLTDALYLGLKAFESEVAFDED